MQTTFNPSKIYKTGSTYGEQRGVDIRAMFDTPERRAAAQAHKRTSRNKAPNPTDRELREELNRLELDIMLSEVEAELRADRAPRSRGATTEYLELTEGEFASVKRHVAAIRK